VEVKVLVAAWTNTDIYIAIWAYEVTVNSKCFEIPRLTKFRSCFPFSLNERVERQFEKVLQTYSKIGFSNEWVSRELHIYDYCGSIGSHSATQFVTKIDHITICFSALSWTPPS
jgi:hypothetical protein